MEKEVVVIEAKNEETELYDIFYGVYSSIEQFVEELKELHEKWHNQQEKFELTEIDYPQKQKVVRIYYHWNGRSWLSTEDFAYSFHKVIWEE